MTNIRTKVMARPEADRLEYAISALEAIIPSDTDSRVMELSGDFGISNQEAKILFTLGARMGKVVPTSALYTALYGPRGGGTKDIVRVLVCRLRKKLPPHMSIETVHGKGLRLTTA